LSVWQPPLSVLSLSLSFSLFQAVYEENLRDKRRLLGPEHPATLMVHMNVATVRREMGQVEKAEEMFQLNWETKKRALGAKHLDTCFAAINLQVREDLIVL